MKLDLNLHHFKIGFGDAAIGAFPIRWNISPHRTWRDSIFWKAFGLVVNKSTHNALPRFHIHPFVLSQKCLLGLQNTWLKWGALKYGSLLRCADKPHSCYDQVSSIYSFI
jgi:hypothetical protein